MPVAVLHAEYAPSGGSGGRCASGEFIVGPNTAFSPFPDRFTVFDPVAKTAKTYAVTLPFTWTHTSFGVAYQGGVAVVAAHIYGSSGTYLLVLYPDGTYDVVAAPISNGTAFSLAVAPSGDLWMIYTNYSTAARVWDGTSWSTAGSGLPYARTTLNVVGSTIWYASNANVYGVSTVTGAVVTTHTTGNLGDSSQTEIYDGRIWGQSGATNLRGVRLSDGNTVDITTPSVSSGRLALGGNKFWIASSTSGFEIDPATSNSVTHPHPSGGNIGTVNQMFYGAGRGWAMGANPTS